MTAFRRERERLTFVEGRDGTPAAIEFARRTFKQYRAALAERNQGGFRSGYGLAYRKELVISCLVFRNYIRSNRNF